MQGLILASYVLREHQRASNRRTGDFAAIEQRAHASARRALASISASLVGLGVVLTALDVLR